MCSRLVEFGVMLADLGEDIHGAFKSEASVEVWVGKKVTELMTLARESISRRISVCLVKLHALSAPHTAVAPSTVGENDEKLIDSWGQIVFSFWLHGNDKAFLWWNKEDAVCGHE